MNATYNTAKDDPVLVLNPDAKSRVVVVCEHASCFIPDAYNDLGLTGDALTSHIAWDPGALEVAKGLAERLDATLVASNISRLVYDCNRPSSAADATPVQSEAIKVPGNANLTAAQRAERVNTVYEPFRARLAKVNAGITGPIIVTIHSFTPIYHGAKRPVEIGILHDTDTRLADALLHVAPQHTDALVLRNEPYGPQHGVTHTLKEHALPFGHLNVMLEVRNDLLHDATVQDAMAGCIANWLSDALAQLQQKGVVQCQD
ncbi:MAG: N-formylglutamate amidohydrolase [Sulfitobacter sp.]